jgi:amino acid adenylation domain-containing protein
MQLVQEFLENSALRSPHKIALIYDRQRLTYAEIDARANRLANALIRLGLARGDRVLLYLPNCIELVIGIFGVLKADGVFVVINSTTKQDKLTYYANNCQATFLLAPTRQARVVANVMQQAPSLAYVLLTGEGTAEWTLTNNQLLDFNAVLARASSTLPSPRCIDRDLACLIYTSGSTGEPKGVMSAHSNVVFAATSIISYMKNTADDVVIVVLPLSFDYGLYQLLMTFKFGGTLVLERSFAYPAQILQRMQEERVTGFPGVPTIYAILLQMDLSNYDLSSLRYLSNTAAALPSSHIRQIQQKFPGATLYSMYGLTETKRTLYLPPDQLDKHPDSVGIAIPGTEVWIEDEKGNRLGPNKVGELVIRGGHVMRGYWGDPQASAARYRSGPLPGEQVCYSDDLFRMDDEGYFYFVGRKDDIIKSRGEKVAPKEVENILYSLPGVVEAAVIGVPDVVLGEAIKAVIVRSDPGVGEKDVLQHCRANLEDFMVPQLIEFRDELPKTSSGKINKRELK